MRRAICFFLLIIFIALHSDVQGQSSGIKAAVGSSFNPSKKAAGYLLTLGFQKKVGKKSSIGFEVGHFFNSSRGILPKDLSNLHFVFRDYTNYEPLGETNNPFGWSATSFPGIRMLSKPNRYFNFNFGGKYFFHLMENARDKIQVGTGVGLSYHDEMELVKIIEATNIQTTVPSFSGVDYRIPMFSYNTYLDFTILTEATYTHAIGNNLLLGLSAQLLYYPLTQNWIIGSALIISVGL